MDFQRFRFRRIRTPDPTPLSDLDRSYNCPRLQRPFARNGLKYFLAALMLWVAVLPMAGFASIKATNFDTRSTKLSLPFIENTGQLNKRISFYAQTWAGSLFVTKGGELIYALPQAADKAATEAGKETYKSIVFTETLVGAGKHDLSGENKSPTVVNIYHGNDKSRWREHLAAYETVRFGEVYPGIELKLNAHGDNFEKLFFIKPNGNVADIRLLLDGAKNLSIDAAGRLILTTVDGSISFTAPIAYQYHDGIRTPVEVSYAVNGDQYGFSVGDYDKTRTLVIDPLLASTYLGGSNDDYAYAMALSGNSVLVAGQTKSIDFPGASGTVNALGDVLVARLSSDLESLVSVSIFGGTTSTDVAVDMVLGGSSIYLTGQVNSSDFPLIGGGYSSEGPTFVAKMDANLNLQVTTRFPANNVYGLAVDASGNVFMAGATISSLPRTDAGTASDTSDDGYQVAIKGTGDGFISKFSSNLKQLFVTTYLGGTEQSYAADIIHSIAIDASGSVYVAGVTTAADFPTTPGAYDNSYAHTPGDQFYWSDIFVSRFTNNLHELMASTYVGGVNADTVKGGFYGGNTLLAEDSGVYIAGDTISSDFPVDRAIGPLGGTDAFLIKFNNNLSFLEESVRIGGGDQDSITAIAIYANEVFVAGETGSSNFPTTIDAFKSSTGTYYLGGFIGKFSSDLQQPRARTLIAGLVEKVRGIAVDAAGRLVIAGYLYLDGYPTKPNAYQRNLSGGNDIFVSRFSPDLSAGQLSAAPIDIDYGYVRVEYNADQDIVVSNSGSSAVNISNIAFAGGSSSDFSETHDCGESLPGLDECTITVRFKPTGDATRNATLVIESNDTISPRIEISLTGTGYGSGPGPAIKVDPEFRLLRCIPNNEDDGVILISNTGDTTVTIIEFRLQGADSQHFRLGANTCGSPLSPGQSCRLTLYYSPKEWSNPNHLVTLLVVTDDPVNPIYDKLIEGTTTISGESVRSILLFEEEETID